MKIMPLEVTSSCYFLIFSMQYQHYARDGGLPNVCAMCIFNNYGSFIKAHYCKVEDNMLAAQNILMR
jgi:hypothetical protein